MVTVDDDIGEVDLSNDYLETEAEEAVLVIRDRDQFETVLHCVNMGISFRKIAKTFRTFGRVIGNMRLGAPDPKLVGRYVRCVVALNLAALKLLLNKAWGFALMVDGATHKKEGYLDMRVSFGLNGAVHNFHYLAIPMGHDAHTGENYAELVLDVLEDVGGRGLLRRLVGISTDGEAVMLGRHQGFATRVRAAEHFGNSSVVVNWCGSHQFNLAVDAFLRVLDEHVNFRSRLGAEISFTRRHERVRLSVGLCPTYASTRWESIHDTCHVLVKHYAQLVRLQDEKSYAQSSSAWWLCLFVVSEQSEQIRACFRKL